MSLFRFIASTKPNRRARRLLDRRRKPVSVGAFWPGLEGLEERTVLSFLAPVSYASGTAATAVAVADFNGDGQSDVVAVNSTSVGAVSVLLGNGNGTFQAARSSPAGASPTSVAVADFNGDGHADLALTSSANTGLVSLLLGNGDGTFQAPVAYTLGNTPTHVAVGDLNGDGHPDLVTTSTSTGTVSVMLGKGDGTFLPRVDYAAGSSPNSVVLDDFDHDGHRDIAVGDQVSAGTISILRGNGDGTFQPPVSYASGSSPASLHEGDFNGDGIPDLMYTNLYPGWVSEMEGNGDGTYRPPTILNNFASADNLETGDFNGDGKEDVVERNSGGYEIQLGRGDGSFYPAVGNSSISGAGALVSGDFNDDGAPDLVTSSNTGTVSVLMNANNDRANLAGAVSFQVSAPASTTAGAAVPVTVTAVDANGNRVPGFLGTVYFTTSDAQATAPGLVFAYTFTAADAGAHVFSDALNLITVGSQTVTASAPWMASASATVVVNPGAATHFGFVMASTTTAGSPLSTTVTAYDQYGNQVTQYAGTVHLTSSDAKAILPADYTFTPADAGSHTFAVTFETATTGSNSTTLTVTDTTAASVTSTRGLISVLPAAASTLTVSGGAGPIGVPRTVTVTVLDPYGNVVTSDNDTVHFASSDTQAVLPADSALSAGTGTFQVTFMTVGTETLSATDTVNPSLSGTETVTTTPASAASFVVTGYPSTVAGAAQSFTVTVKDTLGNVATRYTGTVVFSSSDVKAGLPASYTFTVADAGVHTFTATLKTAGSQSISVRDGQSPSVTGSETGIAVTPAAAATFSIVGPVATVAGSVMNVQVVARDQFGNVATGYQGTVTFSSSDAQAALPATYTFTAADAGTHTFAVILKTAALQSITVQDAAAGLTATQSGINVAAAAATHFSVSAPGSVVAGTSFSVRVIAVDAYGNEANGYRGKVHFSTTATSAGLPSDYTFTSTDNGAHTFSVVLNTTGTQTITVADVATTSIKGSISLTVSTSTSGGGTGGGGTGGGGTGGGGTGGSSGGTGGGGGSGSGGGTL